jgi:Arc/MetJ-type ribon-helix-helix transcriptional regulator
MRTTKSVTISLPPAQLRTAQRLARRQNRTLSELFREGLRRLEQEEEQRSSPVALGNLHAVIQAIQDEARRAGLDKMKKSEINAEIEAARGERAAMAGGSARRRGR